MILDFIIQPGKQLQGSTNSQNGFPFLKAETRQKRSQKFMDVFPAFPKLLNINLSALCFPLNHPPLDPLIVKYHHLLIGCSAHVGNLNPPWKWGLKQYFQISKLKLLVKITSKWLQQTLRVSVQINKVSICFTISECLSWKVAPYSCLDNSDSLVL